MGLLDIPWLTDSLKKRALRYLLQRYLGHFLSEKLTLEQLSVDLYDGTGSITDLSLDVDGLNEELIFLPFKFKHGCTIDSIACSIPWSNLMRDSCSLQINGANFTAQIMNKDGVIDTDKLLESSHLSRSMMSSSMQMAEEIASSDGDEVQQFEGLQLMAKLIDSVLRRVKLVAKNTRFVLESAKSFPGQKSGQGSSGQEKGGQTRVEFKIAHLRCEEESIDASDGLANDPSLFTPGNIDKLLTFEGVEILINNRTVCKVGGTHSIKIQASSTKSDLSIHVGSPFLAIMTTLQLDSFLSVFTPSPDPDDHSSLGGRKIMSDQEMTSRDFARVERQLQEEAAAAVYHQPKKGMINPIGNHVSYRGQSGWSGSGQSFGTPSGQPPFTSGQPSGTSQPPFIHSPLSPSPGWSGQPPGGQFDPSSQEGMKFLPLESDLHHASADQPTDHKFNCYIKIPGIFLCLLTRNEVAPPVPIIPLVGNDLKKINSFIDNLIKEKDHLRFIAFPIQMNADQSTITMTFGDVSVSEYDYSGHSPLGATSRSDLSPSSGSSLGATSRSDLSPSSGNFKPLPILWSESSQKEKTTPAKSRFRLELRKDSESHPLSTLTLQGTDGVTRITLDPTLLERIGKYFPADGSTGGTDYATDYATDFKTAHQSNTEISLDYTLIAKSLKIDWLFPVPDLREELDDKEIISGNLISRDLVSGSEKLVIENEQLINSGLISEENEDNFMTGRSDWNDEEKIPPTDERINQSKLISSKQLRSQLRKEKCESVIENFNLTTNLRVTSATFDSFKGYLLDCSDETVSNEDTTSNFNRDEDTTPNLNRNQNTTPNLNRNTNTTPSKDPILFLDASRNAVEPIEILIASGPNVIASIDDNNLESNYFDSMGGGMEDSIYISNSRSNQSIDTFMIKRRIFTGNHESIIGPSDRSNTLKYLDQSRTSTKLQIDMNIPIGQVVVDSKTLNLVYNRFGNDLIMWSPKIQSSDSIPDKEWSRGDNWSRGDHWSRDQKKRSTIRDHHQPSYFMCKSGLADSIDSDSSFHSIDGTLGHGMSDGLKNRSVICVNVQEIFFDGIGSEDVSTGQESGGQVSTRAQFTERISGQKVLFGAVIGSEHEKKNTVFLNGQNVSLTRINASALGSVSQGTNKELIIENNHLKDSTSSLDMTFDILKESSELKRIKLALGLSNALLHNNNTVPRSNSSHKDSTSSPCLDHFKFLWSLINVTDEPILGYFPPKIVTEVHVSLTNGAVAVDGMDSRGINDQESVRSGQESVRSGQESVRSGQESVKNGSFTRPAIITFDDIYLTSKVVESSCQLFFRLILEEVSLYFIKSKSLIRTSSLALRHYIRVMAAGLTDLNIKLKDNDSPAHTPEDGSPRRKNVENQKNENSSKFENQKNENSSKFENQKNERSSKLELTISSSGVVISACSDSLNALSHFILHLATSNSFNDQVVEDVFEDADDRGNCGQERRTSVNEDDINEAMADSELSDDGSTSGHKRTFDTNRIGENENDLFIASSPPDNGSSPDESGFFVLGEDDVGAGIKPGREPQVRILIPSSGQICGQEMSPDEGIEVIDNHFGPSKARRLPEVVKETVQRFLLDELSLVINIYAGKDFEDEQPNEGDEATSGDKFQNEKLTVDLSSYEKSSKTASSSTREKEELRVRFADDGAVHLWESLDLMSTPGAFSKGYDTGGKGNPTGGAGNSYSGSSCATASKGGRFRDTNTCVQLYLSKVKALFETFDNSSTFPVSWRFIFMVHEFEIRDKLINSSINKMLYEFSCESLPRRNHVSMLSLKAISRINHDDGHEEVDIKVSAKPLRVNIDQDTLMFLIDFFNSIDSAPSGGGMKKSASKETVVNGLQVPSGASSSTTVPSPSGQAPPGAQSCAPTITAPSGVINGSMEGIQEDDFDTESRDVAQPEVIHGQPGQVSKRRDSNTSMSSKPPAIYVKSFIFSPDVPIRLDYQGKRVDFDLGALQGILMGLAQLNQSELRLKRLCNKHGILGLDRVLMYAINEWTRDVRRHQLPSLLGGVGPVHSFVQLFQGMKDLIFMPIDQYKKDKRIVRGLQKGASSFSNSTAMAVLDLANQFVHLVQNAAQFAHDVVSPNSYHHQVQRRSGQSGACPGGQFDLQPRDVREGMSAAYATLNRGMNEIIRNVSAAASKGADTDHPVTGTIGLVVKEVPSVPFRTIVSLSDASSKLLTGTRNQLTPDARVDHEKKWKRRDSTEHR